MLSWKEKPIDRFRVQRTGINDVNETRKSLLPALLAVSGGIAASPASAFELGDITVESRLGQPLRASIAYALGPNEQIAGYCIAVSPGLAANGLPAVTRAGVSVANGVIQLTGTAAVREPLMSVRVDINCPYTPRISREYMLFIDPAIERETPAPVAVARPAPAAARPVATEPPVAPPARRERPPVADLPPIAATERYRVQPGDTLSVIAQRIENRPVGLWDAVNRIFEANPDAFLDNDPNRLKAGTWLVLPDFGSATVADSQPVFDTAAPAQPVAQALPAPGIYEPPVAEPAAPETASEPAEVESTTAADAYEAAAELDVVDDTSVLEPIRGDNSVTDTAELVPGDVVFDTEIEPVADTGSANVPTAVAVAPATEQPTTGSPNWLWWLGGAGLALIAGLLAFGRRRAAHEPEPVTDAPVEHPMQQAADVSTVEVTEIHPIEPVVDVDYELEDDSPTQENLALDADLFVGTGLSDGTEVDIAQDFGYAASAELDLELPEEHATSESPETDVIPPPMIERSSILESEVLPDDDEYDMSVVVDATKMPQPDEITERDLKAVVVDGTDETLIADNYTVSQEADYHILEQDYEDEMTATQALNLEIERAAAALAERMEEIDPTDKLKVQSEESEAEPADEDDSEGLTTEMPMATVTPIDATASLPQSEDVVADDDVADDQTTEMPARRESDDDTAEMTIESGTINTKAR